MNNRRVLSVALLAGWLLVQTLPAQAQAESDKPARETAHLVGIGAVELLDTYLSPENYQGTDFRYLAMTHRTARHHLARQALHQGDLSVSHNRADNNQMLAGSYQFEYSLRRCWNLGPHLRAEGGGGSSLLLGFVYNTRNSNNPAQAKFALNICPSGSLSYDFHAGRKHCTLRYEASAPLCGLQFSPNYGQSYYEIFSRGNYDHNIVPTTFFATPSMRQMLSIDVPFLHRIFRIGYLGDYQQTRVNHLKYHAYAHALVIGIVNHKTNP